MRASPFLWVLVSVATALATGCGDNTAEPRGVTDFVSDNPNSKGQPAAINEGAVGVGVGVAAATGSGAGGRARPLPPPARGDRSPRTRRGDGGSLLQGPHRRRLGGARRRHEMPPRARGRSSGLGDRHRVRCAPLRRLRGARAPPRRPRVARARARVRPFSRRDGAGSRRRTSVEAAHRLLGDGHHAAQTRRRQRRADRQPAPPARSDRAAGRGPVPVRGHSNVQGDRTMGVWERVPPWIDALEREAGFSAPRKDGLDVVGTLEGLIAGRVRVLLCLGGNLLSAGPDTERAKEGFRRAALTVVIATKLNRSMVVTGRTALILPCLGRTERDVQKAGPQLVTVEDSMSVVHASVGRLPPAGEALRSEVAIVCGLADAAVGARSRAAPSTVPWSTLADDYRAIRSMIERVVPGFERFEERIAAGGFVLPSPVNAGEFHTESGKARLSVHAIPEVDPGPGRMVMMTIRSHDQFNTVVYDLDDRYRGVRGLREVVFIHPGDLVELGLAPGDLVDISSHFRGEIRTITGFRCVAFAIARRCCATYFPEANALVPLDSFADGSRTPTSKSVVVTLAPSASR